MNWRLIVLGVPLCVLPLGAFGCGTAATEPDTAATASNSTPISGSGSALSSTPSAPTTTGKGVAVAPVASDSNKLPSLSPGSAGLPPLDMYDLLTWTNSVVTQIKATSDPVQLGLIQNFLQGEAVKIAQDGQSFGSGERVIQRLYEKSTLLIDSLGSFAKLQGEKARVVITTAQYEAAAKSQEAEIDRAARDLNSFMVANIPGDYKNPK